MPYTTSVLLIPNKVICKNMNTDLQCKSESRPFTLTKKDVKANIRFPLLWNQKQCLCCFKDTRNYEAYNNILQTLIVTAISLLQNFNDENKITNTNIP